MLNYKQYRVKAELIIRNQPDNKFTFTDLEAAIHERSLVVQEMVLDPKEIKKLRCVKLFNDDFKVVFILKRCAYDKETHKKISKLEVGGAL